MTYGFRRVFLQLQCNFLDKNMCPFEIPISSYISFFFLCFFQKKSYFLHISFLTNSSWKISSSNRNDKIMTNLSVTIKHVEIHFRSIQIYFSIPRGRHSVYYSGTKNRSLIDICLEISLRNLHKYWHTFFLFTPLWDVALYVIIA